MQNNMAAGDSFFDDLSPEEMQVIGYLLCGFHEEDILKANQTIDKAGLTSRIVSIFKKNDVETQAELQAIYFGRIKEDVFLAKAESFRLKERGANTARLLLRGESSKSIRSSLNLMHDRHFIENCRNKLGLKRLEGIFVLFHDDSTGVTLNQKRGRVMEDSQHAKNPFQQKAYDYFNQLAKGKFTRTELETIPYVLEGLTNKEGARRIPFLSVGGYGERLKSIFRKCRELGLDITTKEKLQAHFYSATYIWDEEIFEQRCEAAKLREAQKRVVRGLLEGKSNQEIAASIGILSVTVSDHTKDVYRKLGIHRRKKIYDFFYGGLASVESIGPVKVQSQDLLPQEEGLSPVV